MQSFHRSRGRILFEVFCAFAIAESCVGAWKQTGASALLPAAVVAALYGVVHAFDMIGRKSTVAASVPAVEETFVVPLPVEESTGENGVEVAATAEQAPAREARARRPKAAPKGARRRAAAREQKIVEIAAPEDVQVAGIAPAVEPGLVAPREEPKAAEAAPPDEPNVTPLPRVEEPPVPLAPLFEPEPFVRQQRAVFGRKA